MRLLLRSLYHQVRECILTGCTKFMSAMASENGIGGDELGLATFCAGNCQDPYTRNFLLPSLAVSYCLGVSRVSSEPPRATFRVLICSSRDRRGQRRYQAFRARILASHPERQAGYQGLRGCAQWFCQIAARACVCSV